MFVVMAVVLIFRPYGLLGREEAPGEARPGRRTGTAPLGARSTADSCGASSSRSSWPCWRRCLLSGSTISRSVLVMADDGHHRLSLRRQPALHAIGLGGNGLLRSCRLLRWWRLRGGAPGALRWTRRWNWRFLLAPTASLGSWRVIWSVGSAFGSDRRLLRHVESWPSRSSLWSVVYPVGVELTGGDDGILGIWPSAWASRAPRVYYYLTLVIACAGGIVACCATCRPCRPSVMPCGLAATRNAAFEAAAPGST